jgi:hypothetical protein
MAISSRNSTDLAAAFWKDCAMVAGWMPGFSLALLRTPRDLTLRQQLLRSSKQTSRKDDDACRSISCLNVLRLR